MERREELNKVFSKLGDNLSVVDPLLDDVVFLEQQLDGLRKLPFIRINPADNSQQRATPASKQYKELLQQYNNCIKTLAKFLGKDEAEDNGPLEEWFKTAASKYG